jgi:Caudovirus prohead serine protease
VFLERMERNAFAAATEGREDVELRREHLASGPVFASTSRRSLAFSDEPTGLLLAAALSKSDSATQTLVQDVRAGTLTGLSGMIVTGDAWGTAADGRTALRTISRAAQRGQRGRAAGESGGDGPVATSQDALHQRSDRVPTHAARVPRTRTTTATATG